MRDLWEIYFDSNFNQSQNNLLATDFVLASSLGEH